MNRAGVENVERADPESELQTLAELERMQDDVLRRLDELNARIESTLAQAIRARSEKPQATPQPPQRP